MFEIPRILEKNEKLEWDDKPKYAPYMIPIIFGAIIVLIIPSIIIFAGGFSKLWLIAAAALSIWSIIWGNLSYSRMHYAITNKRVIIQAGVIGRDFRSIDHDRIQNASVDVGLLGVIFKVGTILIYTGEMESYSTGGGGSPIRIGGKFSVGGGGGTGIKPKYDKFAYIPEQYEVLKLLQEHLSKRKESLYSGNAYNSKN